MWKISGNLTKCDLPKRLSTASKPCFSRAQSDLSEDQYICGQWHLMKSSLKAFKEINQP